MYKINEMYGLVGISKQNYPLFSAEKQIKIMLILSLHSYFCIQRNVDDYMRNQNINGIKITVGNGEDRRGYCFGLDEKIKITNSEVVNHFANCLASFVIEMWSKLSNKEQQEIKTILSES